jgi:putative transposase
MSVIESVTDSTSITVSDEPSTVRDVENRPLRELVDDRLLDELLARSRDEAGGLRLTGEGSMLGELAASASIPVPAALRPHPLFDRPCGPLVGSP